MVEVVVAALVVVARGGALATPVVGTVRGGAPAVFVVDGDPLPQADEPDAGNEPGENDNRTAHRRGEGR